MSNAHETLLSRPHHLVAQQLGCIAALAETQRIPAIQEGDFEDAQVDTLPPTETRPDEADTTVFTLRPQLAGLQALLDLSHTPESLPQHVPRPVEPASMYLTYGDDLLDS